MPPETWISRRRVLRLSAVALAGAGVALWPRKPPPVTWTGQAMGGPASLTLHGAAEETARRLVSRVVALVDAMEGLFSLYRPDSLLSRLNREGEVGDPPAAFTHLLGQALTVAAATGGAFDPTVQPLWELYRGGVPDAAGLQAALGTVGWQRVMVARDRVRLQPGTQLTLNGIAQGYITDRVTDLLLSHGVGHMLVDMGEPRGIGLRDDGQEWRLGIADPDAVDRVLSTVPVSGRAIATSAPRGTLIDAAGRIGHILDPVTGLPATAWRQVSVAAATATMADALSTAIAAAAPARAASLIGDSGASVVLGVVA
ncbi:MAG: FAD:protein FMN transferase [Niveispirillum sp.]|nr:FAD:protein FMN transferase [Niveispirillum sp.]